MSDTLDLLEDVMDDSELAALIEKANASGDPESVYREAYDRLTQDAPDIAEEKLNDEMVKRGIRIEQVTRVEVNQATREEETKVEGYDIRIERDNLVLWMGKTLSPGPRYNSIPFENEAKARSAVRVWIDLQEANKPRYAPSRWCYIRVPVSVDYVPSKSSSAKKQVSIRLSEADVETVNAVYRALRYENLEDEDGKPIDGDGSAVRWLIETLRKAL